jgi:hypothetical protein
MMKWSYFLPIPTMLTLLTLPALAQEAIDPPLKDWPVAAYWAPSSSNGEKTIKGRGKNEGETRDAATIGNAAAGATRPLSFIAITPCRLVDTRLQIGTFGGPSLQPGQNAARDFPIPSHPTCAIPSSALAYSLNFTVVPARTLDYLAAFPALTQWSGVSTLNAQQGGVVANAAIVPAGTNGAITVFGTQTTDLIIDINGYFAQSGTAIALSGIISADGTPQVLPAGTTVTHPGTGQYVITFPAGTFAPGSTTSFPVPFVSPLGTATTTTIQSTANGNGTFQLTVNWTANTTFYFSVIQN